MPESIFRFKEQAHTFVLKRIHDKPMALIFGDDKAFGPLKCDLGSVGNITFNRPRCPAELTCEDENSLAIVKALRASLGAIVLLRFSFFANQSLLA